MEMPIKSVTSILGEKRCGAKIGGYSWWVAAVEAPHRSIKRKAPLQVNRAGHSQRVGEGEARGAAEDSE